MGKNAKEIKVSEVSKKKKNPNLKQEQRDSMPFESQYGFLLGPPPSGYHYRIPSDTLYNPTGYAINAVGSNGQEQPLNPFDTSNTEFPGADYVDEYEQLRRGGTPKSLKKYTSQNIKTSINNLMRRNETLFGPSGKKYYRPMQDGGQGLNEDQEFLINMANSPLFGERFAKMTGQPVPKPIPYAPEYPTYPTVNLSEDSFKKSIIDNVKSVEYAPKGEGDFTKKVNEVEAAAYYLPELPVGMRKFAEDAVKAGKRFDDIDTSEVEKMLAQKRHAIYTRADEDRAYTRTHETSHASTLGELLPATKKSAKFQLPPNTYNEYWEKGLTKRNKAYYEDPVMQEYLSNPTEIKARIDAARKMMSDKKEYDPINQKFDEGHYEKLLKHALDEGNTKDLLFNFPKEEVIRLFNETVSNKPKSVLMAKKGGQANWLSEFE